MAFPGRPPTSLDRTSQYRLPLGGQKLLAQPVPRPRSSAGSSRRPTRRSWRCGRNARARTPGSRTTGPAELARRSAPRSGSCHRPIVKMCRRIRLGAGSAHGCRSSVLGPARVPSLRRSTQPRKPADDRQCMPEVASYVSWHVFSSPILRPRLANLDFSFFVCAVG